jgi:hypothetical protein
VTRGGGRLLGAAATAVYLAAAVAAAVVPKAPWVVRGRAWRAAALGAAQALLDAARLALASPPRAEVMAAARAALAEAAARMERPPLLGWRDEAWWALRAAEKRGDAAGVAAAEARIAALEGETARARARVEALRGEVTAAEDRLIALRALPVGVVEERDGERCPTCHLGMAEGRAALVASLALPAGWGVHPGGGVPAGRCSGCHGGEGGALEAHGGPAAPSLRPPLRSRAGSAP